jgi:hypothetical protein
MIEVEWALIESLLSALRVARRGGQWLDDRQVINGVLELWKGVEDGLIIPRPRVRTPPASPGKIAGCRCLS